MSFGRRGLVKFGGRAGAAIARRPPPPVPWNAAVESRAFRDFVFDLLNGADARVNSFCDPRGVQARLHAAFETSTLYPIGLLLTFEP